ncbi:MAG TPA: GNAT family N-acetyltransferase [Dehalococcoidia bacterium]|nr:GNAT family N-acetyltransferase [Dehalococcoidia bacterium]
MGEIIVRPATEADVPAITEIYNYEVLNGWATFDLEPKSIEDRLEWFRETVHPHFIIVAEEAGEVVGWGCLRAFHERAAYRFTAQNSVYVHQDHRGRGVGRLLLAGLIEWGREHGFHSIMAGISQDNPASDRLHQSLGFECVGTEREVGYKFERWLDVTWWQLMLSQPDR